jgi:thiamine-monophosphate kinase
MRENKEKLTELQDLGEFGLIDRLINKVKVKNSSTIRGIGDDAAVIKYTEKMSTLVSKDMLLEGVHFDLTYTPLKHLGYKAAITNFSDIAAMNGKPKQMLIGLAVSSRFSVEAIEEFYEGLLLACEKYKVDLVGGDTTSSQSGMVISITIIGEAVKEEIIYRNTANEYDLLCVSGDLGGAYMGLLLLEREKAVFKVNPNMQPDLSGNEYILQRQLKPEARTDMVDILRALKIKPTSMIDISDGLASEIFHICTGSKKGCNLYEDKIPIDPSTILMAQEFQIDPTVCALSGGEDYELLFTIKQEDFEKVKHNPNISVIGHITDEKEGINLITRSGTSVPITAQGWDAFTKRNIKSE